MNFSVGVSWEKFASDVTVEVVGFEIIKSN